VSIAILLCYAQQDKVRADQLKDHLSSLERNARITILDYGNIVPGAEWKQEIDKHLKEAQIILLLISSDFLASDYCYKVEMREAIQRHERKEAQVIPVLVRPVHWQDAPLDKLRSFLPDNGKAISKWTDRDEGFTNVTSGIVKVLEQWNSHSLPDPTVERGALMTNLDQLIEAVKLHIQPEPRAMATAKTLQQLSIFIPNDVTLADLITGWQILSHSSKQDEEPAISQRRVTCDELASIASQFTKEQGNLAQAVKTWQIWRDAFKNGNDPRKDTMTATFARELAELQKASH